MAKLLPAKQARKKTKENIQLCKTEALQEIAKQINDAIEKGKFYVHIYEHVEPEVVQYLREHEYRVDVHYDQRDGDLVTIYWN